MVKDSNWKQIEVVMCEMLMQTYSMTNQKKNKRHKKKKKSTLHVMKDAQIEL